MRAALSSPIFPFTASSRRRSPVSSCSRRAIDRLILTAMALQLLEFAVTGIQLGLRLLLLTQQLFRSGTQLGQPLARELELAQQLFQRPCLLVGRRRAFSP